MDPDDVNQKSQHSFSLQLFNDFRDCFIFFLRSGKHHRKFRGSCLKVTDKSEKFGQETIYRQVTLRTVAQSSKTASTYIKNGWVLMTFIIWLNIFLIGFWLLIMMTLGERF